jgi:hypothetical protein
VVSSTDWPVLTNGRGRPRKIVQRFQTSGYTNFAVFGHEELLRPFLGGLHRPRQIDRFGQADVGPGNSIKAVTIGNNFYERIS